MKMPAYLLLLIWFLALCAMGRHARAQDTFVRDGLQSSADFWREEKPRVIIKTVRIPYRVWRADELKPCVVTR